MTSEDKFKDVPSSQIPPTSTKESTTSFNKLNKQLFDFFRKRDYESFETFKEGYCKVISEDYRNIDILCNLNDLVYNYMASKNMKPEEKQNLKQLCNGIQMINKSLKQYDTNETDKLFVALLSGYILKLVKNFYHD
jgi:hypothetical protein